MKTKLLNLIKLLNFFLLKGVTFQMKIRGESKRASFHIFRKIHSYPLLISINNHSSWTHGLIFLILVYVLSKVDKICISTFLFYFILYTNPRVTVIGICSIYYLKNFLNKIFLTTFGIKKSENRGILPSKKNHVFFLPF